MTESEVCLRLFLGWLDAAQGRRFEIESSAALPREGLAATTADAGIRIAAEVQPLLDPSSTEPWLAARRHLEEELAASLPGACALWLPAGADLPFAPDETRRFVELVRTTAAPLAPGERADVPFPITLYLRKTSDEGGLVSVTGGLNPHWARFTERVRGTYDLDSTRLHRLQEGEEYLESLIDTITAEAARLSPGQWVEIETVDAWSVQRLADGEGFAIIGRPPEETADMGLAVRRNFRRLLADAAPRLREARADLRALIAIGHYARMESEGATTALRGYDPALYAGLDFICLASDGLIKPLVQSPVTRAG